MGSTRNFLLHSRKRKRMKFKRETEALNIPTPTIQDRRSLHKYILLFASALLLSILALFASHAHAEPAADVTTGAYDPDKLYDTTAVVTGSTTTVFDAVYNQVGFYYWEDDGSLTPPGTAEWKQASFDSGSATQFSATLDNLKPNTTYAYMAYFNTDTRLDPPELVWGEKKTFLTYWYYLFKDYPQITGLPNGTLANQVPWPAKVEVTMPDYTTKYMLPVEWNYTNYEDDQYSTYPSGWTYSQIGGYKSFEGIISPDPAHPNITFDPRGFASDKSISISLQMDYSNLTSVQSVSNFTLPVGSTLNDVNTRLPSSLNASFSNGKNAPLPVKWDEGTPTFDGTKAGTYTFKGQLGCLIEEQTFAAPKKLYGASFGGITPLSIDVCGYYNPNNIEPSVTVTIGQSTPPVVTPPVVTTPTPAAPTRTVQVVVANTLGGQTVSQPITSLIGTNLPLSGTLYNANGQPVPGVPQLTLSPNGTLNIPSSVPPGTYNLTLNVIAPNGERLAGPPAKLTIDAAGNARLDAELIDPYGIITDSRTKRPVPGVKVSLHWADTELNRSKGRVPGDMVKLPELPDFAPNRNLDPQNSNAAGQYGWMVYPEGDYYILGEKDGYLMFDSRKDDAKATFGTDSYIRDGVIHVGQTIVEYSFEIDPSSQDYLAYMRGYPDGLFRPERGVTRAEVAAILQRTMVAPLGSDKLAFGDVSASHWAHDDIVLVVTNGWMKGTGGTDFMPDRAITRGEMAQILANIYGWKDAPSTSMFSDANGHWAANAIHAAVSQGAMSGYSDGTFRPNQPITRSETVMLINRLTNRPAAPEIPMTWSDVPMSNANYGDIMAASVDHTSTMQ